MLSRSLSNQVIHEHPLPLHQSSETSRSTTTRRHPSIQACNWQTCSSSSPLELQISSFDTPSRPYLQFPTNSTTAAFGVKGAIQTDRCFQFLQEPSQPFSFSMDGSRIAFTWCRALFSRRPFLVASDAPRDPGPAAVLFLAIRCLPAHGWRTYAVEYGRFERWGERRRVSCNLPNRSVVA